jgi:hypothetical protein
LTVVVTVNGTIVKQLQALDRRRVSAVEGTPAALVSWLHLEEN